MALAALATSSCSSTPDLPPTAPPTPEDPGAVPRLPEECEAPLPETVAEERYPWVFAIDALHVRAAGDTVYFAYPDGIYATKVPDGTPVQVTASPTFTSPDNGPPFQHGFRDFWVDGSSVLGVVGQSVYVAPTSGGPSVLIPGSTAPTYGEIYDSNRFYARAGEVVLHVSDDHRLQRFSLSGGPPSVLLTVRTGSPGPLLASGDSLYFVDQIGGEPGSETSVFAVPLTGGMPTDVTPGLSSPRPIGFDGSLYVSEFGPRAGGLLWRIHADGTRDKLVLPPNVFVWGPGDWARAVTYGGATYWVARAVYQLPDDRRTNTRNVVLRIRADSDVVEVARCLPEPPLDPLVPQEDVRHEVADMVASDAGVYVAIGWVNQKSSGLKARLLKVTP